MIEVTMEIYKDVHKRWMKKYDRYEPVMKDHTQIITAKECFRKYFFQIILGRVAKEEAIYFAWGQAYHTFREVLERRYGFGKETPTPFNETKAQEALGYALEAGIGVWKERGQDQPVGSQWEFMTMARLLKSFRITYDHWVLEKKRGNITVVAVEQPFNISLPNGERTSGRADQIIRWNNRLVGRDFKASSKDEKFYARMLTPNDQFTRYTYSEGKLAGMPISGIMVEVLYNAKPTKSDPKGPKIYTLFASRSQAELDIWELEEQHYRKLLDECREVDIYPACEVSCPFCPYHSVCQKPTEASMMAQLEAHFVVRPWDNTKIGLVDR